MDRRSGSSVTIQEEGERPDRHPSPTSGRSGGVAVAAGAAYQIRRLIVRRGLGSGDKLPSERELTTILGVSRTSVRAALKELEGIGLLSISPARGAFVSGNTSAAIQASIRGWLEANRLSLPEIIECRRAIEPAAAESAAKRRTAEDLSLLQAQLDEMAAAIENDDPQRFGQADTRFHGGVANASGNRLFVAMLDSIAEAIRAYREAVVRLGAALLLRSLHDHTAVYDAIVAGDANGAREAMLHHIVGTALDFHVVAREELT
jgi:GntR family transcriptional repressor for pyruvate dehydrogenase complex